MKSRLLKIISLVLVSLFLVDMGAAFGSYAGKTGSAGSLVIVHDRRHGHRRIFRKPAVIFKFHSPYYRNYYYPQRRYCYYDYGYRYRYCKPSYTPSYNRETLSIIVIADMAKQGVPDDLIIAEIRRTGSVFSLNAEIIAYLKENRVSDRVIDYMMAVSRGRGY